MGGWKGEVRCHREEGTGWDGGVKEGYDMMIYYDQLSRCDRFAKFFHHKIYF